LFYLHRHIGERIKNTYGHGVGAIWLDDVGCSGSENSLAECTHDGWGVHDCHHGKDVALDCSNPPTTATTNGITGSALALQFCKAHAKINSKIEK